MMAAPNLQAGMALELGEVLAVNDEAGLHRVKVRFLPRGPEADDKINTDRHDATPWAFVAAPFAGENHGAFMLPDVGAHVVLGCLNNDWRMPVVLGSMWCGTNAATETLGGDGSRVDRWTMQGKSGTRVALVEEDGQAKVEIETGNTTKVTLDEAAGTITMTRGGSSITMSSTEVTIKATTVAIQATELKVKAPTAKMDCVVSDFSGFVFSDLTQTNTVVSSTITPCAGNML